MTLLSPKAIELEPDENRLFWHIPHTTDVRFIIYWRDMLEDAGVEDEENAFSSSAAIFETCEKLVRSGISTPWAVLTEPHNLTLHFIASWIWGSGSELLDVERKVVGFAEPLAISAIRDYYALATYMPLSDKHISEHGALELFRNRQVAATITGPWARDVLINEFNLPPEEFARIGVAMPPGPPMVGGTNLVVFKHIPARYERAALHLLKTFSSIDVQRATYEETQRLPVTFAAVKSPQYLHDAYLQGLMAIAECGRHLPHEPLWGTFEQRIVMGLNRIWQYIITDPDLDLNAAIIDILEPLSVQINRVLSN